MSVGFIGSSMQRYKSKFKHPKVMSTFQYEKLEHFNSEIFDIWSKKKVKVVA